MPKKKIKEWLKRYLPAEIIGTVTAVVAASVTHLFSESLIFIAYAGSLGEGIGFYSTVFIQHIILVAKKHRKENKTVSFSDFNKIIGNIILEFGPAGLIDGLLLRPFFLYLFPILMQNFTIGILVGKIVCKHGERNLSDALPHLCRQVFRSSSK
ncbi:MAG: hypothetical protein ACYDCN_09145 [Bacteroidia bacterium]